MSLHSTITGTVVPVVVKRRVILMAVTFIEGTVLTSTFRAVSIFWR